LFDVAGFWNAAEGPINLNRTAIGFGFEGCKVSECVDDNGEARSKNCEKI
jgi:hypothetical protein